MGFFAKLQSNFFAREYRKRLKTFVNNHPNNEF